MQAPPKKNKTKKNKQQKKPITCCLGAFYTQLAHKPCVLCTSCQFHSCSWVCCRFCRFPARGDKLGLRLRPGGQQVCFSQLFQLTCSLCVFHTCFRFRGGWPSKKKEKKREGDPRTPKTKNKKRKKKRLILSTSTTTTTP